ncbi:MAG: tol-pal system YbgF family protein [Bacteroidales bacterium]|jgi:tetratricopeptide (TPR) repeat protein
MAKKKKDAVEEPIEGVENLLSKTENYIEENQKSLTIIVTAIVVVVLGYLGYTNLYVAPLENEARSQIYMAERYFEQDSFYLALYGDGNYPGFVDIIDEYSVTSTANLARYYAGISFLRIEEYHDAIDNLTKFDSRDQLVSPVALGAIGDAYVELGELENAASFFTKAARRRANELTSPIYWMKAGMIYEELEKYNKALEAYENIKENYPDTTEGGQIEKYITRVQLKIE